MNVILMKLDLSKALRKLCVRDGFHNESESTMNQSSNE